ncbi:TetR/AcrR family transcriptional regulator [Nocardia sp. NPDC059246]|uniref:TetR/AcrR family transcriptional regulator n=1 Tax=unclassified Nocardia TaxID=2637762 RepID=UPI00368D0835
MTDLDTSRRVRLEADDRREQILVAAQRLFAQRAYETVSTAELAAAAGTTRTNLHHHFGTKRALYLEVVRRFAHLPEPPLVAESCGDVGLDIAQMFDQWLELVERNRETYLSMLRAGAPRRDPEVDAVLQGGMRAWEDRLLVVLRIAPVECNRSKVRAFQSLVMTATDEWLRRGLLTRSDVHSLLAGTLLAIRTQAAPSDAS